jgi:hypothetical protein
VTSSPNPSAFGQGVTFTAVVTSAGSPVTEGQVSFAPLGGPVPVDQNGVATFTTAALEVGEHEVVASYEGQTFAASEGSVTHVVQPGLAISDVTITEPNGGSVTAVFIVSLSPASSQPVTVVVASAAGSATAGSDFSAFAPRTLSFAPGVTSVAVPVSVLGDLRNEATESFSVNLSSAVNAVIADGQGIGTILDNDPVPVLSVYDVAVKEGDSGTRSATFVVRLSALSGRTVTVAYATADGTAGAGGDYSATSGTLTFPAGTLTRHVTVEIHGDTIFEPDESFFLQLSSATAAQIGDGQGTATILDDDRAPRPL